jgi:inorganic pyrophosphatase
MLCKNTTALMTNLLKIPTYATSGYLHGVIEIPAGTNRKYEIDKTTGQMRPDTRNGKPRMVDFLPYPINYGFVPSTIMDKERGGDGDPLDILYLAEHVPNGTVVEAIPIGLLLLQDLGEWDHKVLAIPADPALRIISATTWAEFQMDYSAARHIIEQFFLNYDGPGVMTLHGWADAKAAWAEVEKWRIVEKTS